MRRERRARGVKSGSCRVHSRRGADHPGRRQPLPVFYHEGDGWEAGFNRKYSGGRGREAICGPSLDISPECIDAVRRTHTRCKEIRAVE